MGTNSNIYINTLQMLRLFSFILLKGTMFEIENVVYYIEHYGRGSWCRG